MAETCSRCGYLLKNYGAVCEDLKHLARRLSRKGTPSVSDLVELDHAKQSKRMAAESLEQHRAEAHETEGAA